MFYVSSNFKRLTCKKIHVSIFLFSINFLLKEVKLCPFFELLRFSNDTDAEVVACSTFRNDLTSNKKNSTSFTRNRRSNAVHTSLSPQAKDRKVQHHPQGCVAAQLGGGFPSLPRGLMRIRGTFYFMHQKQFDKLTHFLDIVLRDIWRQ